jgi:hypothetical protein
MKLAGVVFPGNADIHFNEIRAADSLVSNPPAGATKTVALLGRLNHDFNVLRTLRSHV